MKIAIIGSNGFVGNNIYRYLKKDYKITGITKNNYNNYRNRIFDIIINANGNGRKYWAEQNILEDFKSSTVSVYKSLFDFYCRLYIFISTVDIYGSSPSNRKQSIYGFHKYIAEQIIQKHMDSFLIFRCSSILGSGLKKGVVYDIINKKPLFVTKDSKIQFITIEAIADIINILIKKNITNKIFNIGGKGSTSIDFIEHLLSTESSTSKNAKLQIYNTDVSALESLYHLKTSDEYVKDYLKGAIWKQ